MSVDRTASAIIVSVGLLHPPDGKLEPSITKRFATSCVCWNGVSTDVFESVPMKGGQPLPRSTHPASLLRIDTRSWLVTENYEALLAYNCAHTYALSVVALAERLPRH